MIRTALLAATALTFAMPAVAADTTATPASAGISGLGIRNIGIQRKDVSVGAVPPQSG